jgi:hypothetical protein
VKPKVSQHLVLAYATAGQISTTIHSIQSGLHEIPRKIIIPGWSPRLQWEEMSSPAALLLVGSVPPPPYEVRQL